MAPTNELWEEMHEPSSRSKVDPKGRYLPFPNITVVCHLDSPSSSKLKALPETLKAVAGDYLSPLPFASYHTTVVSGPCAFRYSKREWDGILRNSCWGRLAAFLEERNYAPKDLWVTSPDWVVVKSSYGVTMYFSAPTEEPNAPPYQGDEESMVVRNAIREHGHRVYEVEDESDEDDDLFDRESSSVHEPEQRQGECLMSSRAHPWHITLAYGVETSNEMPQSVIDEVRAAVVEAFQDGSPHLICLKPAKLCLSPDMTRFEPWDGTTPQIDSDESCEEEGLMAHLVF